MMHTRSIRHFALLLLAAVFLVPQHASAAAPCTGDCIMTDSFENEFFLPESDADAARFLNQASFGATKASIAAVRASGFEQWIDLQFGTTQTLAKPFLEVVAKARHDANRNLDQNDRIQRWYDTAVTANDQLRQKLAYALGQIIVVSDQNDNLAGMPLQMAEWNDILVRNAFGNYGALLNEASFSPMMGRYLTHLRNRRYELNPTCGASSTCGSTPPYVITSYVADNSGNEPDENYAREIMQLFSIGLESRNRDFSLIDIDPVAPGIQIQPTYDQQMIRTLSRAFTGLAYDCTPTISVQGVSIVQNCGGSRTATPAVLCTGTQCRFNNTNNLFFNDPTRARLPNNSGDSSLIHPDFYKPMVCYPRYNDNGRDVDRFQLPGQGPTNPVNTTFGAGVVIPAGAPDAGKALVLSDTVLSTQQEFQPGVSKETVINCNSNSVPPNPVLSDADRLQCISYCENNIAAAVNLLFNHENTAPMVARQMILHFVSSNPSAAYVDRVAAKFENNGSGMRGDLKAVIKAVLMDREARQPFAGQFGKPREPMLRMVSVWRHFGYLSGGNTCRNNGASTTGNGNIACWGRSDPQSAFFQRPLGAPSVFNFYEPDYQPPGAIANAGLYGPEFQIINENSTMQTANEMFRVVCENYGSDDCRSVLTTLPTDRAYVPIANLDALPGMACALDLVNGCSGTHDRDLIEELNLRMLGGQMSGAIGNPGLCSDPANSGMKSVLHNLLGCGLAGNLGQSGATAAQDARRRKALYLIHLISISPEYAHQR